MADPQHIPGWLRIDERITTSAQPSEADLAQIAALGASHVVNLGLHTHEKALADEGASVAALGMTYVHRPVDFQAPTARDLAGFFDLMRSLRGQTVHVHCIANYRVSAFFYRYRIDVLGWAPEAARVDLERIWQPSGVWAQLIEASKPS